MFCRVPKDGDSAAGLNYEECFVGRIQFTFLVVCFSETATLHFSKSKIQENVTLRNPVTYITIFFYNINKIARHTKFLLIAIFWCFYILQVAHYFRKLGLIAIFCLHNSTV